MRSKDTRGAGPVRPSFSLASRCASLVVSMLFGAAAHSADLTFACDAKGLGAQFCQEGAQEWARRNGHTVKVVQVPRSSTRRLELYKELLDAGSHSIDIYVIDIVWPGILAPSFVDMSSAAKDVVGQHLPSIIANNTVQGRLIAMPWFTDVGLMFYRKDLLDQYGIAVPRTWDALTQAARTIQAGQRKAGKRDFWGYLWQGKASEGLTCNVLEWLVSRGAGRVIDDQGRITVDNAAAAAALHSAKLWIGDISPPAVLTADEDATLEIFSAGHAAFMRNWPYAWALSNGVTSAVRGKVGIAPIPRGNDGQGAATLGGQQLAVSLHSRHRAAAIELVMHLTGREEQKRLALLAGVAPTVMDLYNDPLIKARNPYHAVLRDAVAGAVTRPSSVTGKHYEQVSEAIAATTHGVLADGKDAASSVKELAHRLQPLQAGFTGNAQKR